MSARPWMLASVAAVLGASIGGCTLVEGFDHFRAADAGTGVDGGARDGGADDAARDASADAPAADAGMATLTVAFAATAVSTLGSGHVLTSSLAEIDCGPSGGRCSATVPVGTQVVLTMAPWATASSWDGTTCRPGRSCTLEVTSDLLVTVNGEPIGNLAFVTSSTYPVSAPEVSNASAADAECARVASTAGLPGTFYALFGTTLPEQTSRLGDYTRGYVRLDGRVLSRATTTLDPTIAPLVHPLDIDEHGAPVPVDLDAVAYTGPAASCASGGLGAVHSVRGWITAASIGCTDTRFAARLYCFSSAATHAPIAEPARDESAVYLFVSRPVVSFGSRSAMDAQCVSDAQAAGLPGSYAALVVSSTTPALDVVSRLDAPVLRPDHHALVAHARDLLVQNPLETAPVLLADGSVATVLVGTGFVLASPTTAPGPMQCCSNWTQHDANFSAGVGYPDNAAWPPSSTLSTQTLQDTYARSYGSWTTELSLDCSTMLSVYCIRTD